MNTTIKIVAFALVASFVTVGGCLKKFTTVNFDYKTEATIQTNPLSTVGTQTFGESVLTSGLKQELEKNNTSLDLLDELKLKSVVVSFNGDSTATFDKVENMEFYLASEGNPEVLIASKNPIADGQTSVTLNVNNSENLANYLKGNTFTYRIKGTNSEALPAMDLKAEVIWVIKASAK